MCTSSPHAGRTRRHAPQPERATRGVADRGGRSGLDAPGVGSQLAEQVDITLANLSILKTGKARAMRFSTLDAICTALDCQPGDILRFAPDEAEKD